MGIILVERIMPYACLVQDVLNFIPKKRIPVITLEEEIKAGGFGMMLLDKLSSNSIMDNKKTAIIALEDTFADQYGKDIYKSFGLDAESIANKILSI